ERCQGGKVDASPLSPLDGQSTPAAFLGLRERVNRYHEDFAFPWPAVFSPHIAAAVGLADSAHPTTSSFSFFSSSQPLLEGFAIEQINPPTAEGQQFGVGAAPLGCEVRPFLLQRPCRAVAPGVRRLARQEEDLR